MVKTTLPAMLSNSRRSSETKMLWNDANSRRTSQAAQEMINSFRIEFFSSSRWKLELKLLWKQKILVIVSSAMQFIHAPITNFAYYRHIQGARLKDIGFDLIPLITPELSVLSEFLFFFIITMSILAGLSTFCYRRPPFYFVC